MSLLPNYYPHFSVKTALSVVVLLGMCEPGFRGFAQKSPVVRESDAIHIVELALNAMGGAAAWSGVHTATVQGTSSSGDNIESQAFVWADEWSSKVRMRRDFTDRAGAHRRTFSQGRMGSSSTPAVTKDPTPSGHRKPPPAPFDRATSLLLHLPGAALSVVLQDTSYGVGNAPADQPGTHCVDFAKRTQNHRLDICFSDQTNLPTTAIIFLPNIFNPAQHLTEQLTYLEFQDQGNLTVSRQVLVVDPMHQKKTLTFRNFSWDPDSTESALASKEDK